MNQNLNYPIKYALLELKEPGGWEQNYEEISLCYIVSICYVVNQNIRYNEDGTSKKTYKVVFPYKDIHSFKYKKIFNDKPNTPHYSLWNKCVNSDKVSEIFDTYEEASIAVIKANNNKKRTIFSQISKVSEYNNLIKKFDENLEICQKFEQIIKEKTFDLIITKEDINIKKLTKH